MPARRIFCLARNRRCAIASSLARKARATWAVVSPHTVRSVSATCTSAAKDGWQQVKISRSMSSSSTLSVASQGADACSSNSCVNACCLLRKEMLRRTRSIALWRPTLTSHARGLDGNSALNSALGQRSNATANASCKASSARSKSPTRRIRVASALPASSRKVFSISVGVIGDTRSLGVVPGRRKASNSDVQLHTMVRYYASPRNDVARRRSIINHNRPDLDRPLPGAGNPRGDREGGVEILGLDQIIAGELFARLRERTVGRHGLAVTDAHGGCRRRRLQAVAGLEMAALDNRLGEHAVVRRHFLALSGVHFAELGLVLIDH